jgi:hypothetical protein
VTPCPAAKPVMSSVIVKPDPENVAAVMAAEVLMLSF